MPHIYAKPMPTDNLAESRSVRTCKDEHAHNPTTHIGAEMHRALPPPFFEIKKCVYRYDFIVTAQRENDIFAFYRHRAAREQYFCRFIVTARRGNNIFAVLSSPRGAGTIFLPFYRHRAAREQYFCHFIVAARRGNDTFAVLSSPRGAGTIPMRGNDRWKNVIRTGNK